VPSMLPVDVNGRRVKSPILKRSIVISGHKTSVSLEEPFWVCLREIAEGQQVTVSSIVADIEASHPLGNLSSAIRTFVLNKVREPATIAPTFTGLRPAA
jgi:predicted DNA-binding ribbon-helix-helix protein